METIRIEPAGRESRPALVALLQSLRLPTEDLPADLDGFFLAFDKEGVPVGSVGIQRLDASALLRSFAVHENYRKAGLGRHLFEKALQFARDAGFQEVWLITNSADLYFERQGFERVDRAMAPPDISATSQFTGLCPSSSAVMRKQIQGAS